MPTIDNACHFFKDRSYYQVKIAHGIKDDDKSALLISEDNVISIYASEWAVIKDRIDEYFKTMGE